MGVYNWDKEKDVIIQKISNMPAEFKVCVKLKNEKELLPDLISHLSKAGFLSEEIIIFDNMSDDEEFLEYLNKISERFLVIKYSGDHNLVHTKAFIDAYKALAQSCRYFMFLDADEFPYWIDLENGDLLIEGMKNNLMKYLDEIDESYDTFHLIFRDYPDLFDQIPKNMFRFLLWFKVLFKSKSILTNSKLINGSWNFPYIMHLIQAYFAGCRIYPKFIPVLLIHDKYKYPERTVRINLMKIIRLRTIQNIIKDILGSDFSYDNYSNLGNLARVFINNRDKILGSITDFVERSYVSRNIYEIEKALNEGHNRKGSYNMFKSFVLTNKEFLKTLMHNKIFYGLPHLSYSEVIYFIDVLRTKSMYLEYGSGMSTILAMNFCSNIVSVDNHQKWYETVRSYIAELKKLPFYEKINVYHQFVDTGKVGDWGMPLDESGWKNYHKYVLAPWKIAFKYGIQPDIILIDGRWRVSSFLVSLYFANKGATILFHDYTNRPHYHIVEEYIKPIEIIDTMAIFRKEKDINMDIKMLEHILKYLNFPEASPKPNIIEISKLVKAKDIILINGNLETYKVVKHIGSEMGKFIILRVENTKEMNKVEFSGYINSNISNNQVKINLTFADDSKDTIIIELIEGYKKKYFED